MWAETQREPWPTGEEYKFECKLGHDEPMLHCRCGIYACFDYETLDREWPVVVDGFSHVGGMIAVRGVFLEYEYGLRAQYATVVALFNDVPDGQLAIPKSEIAKAYDIEIISPDEFADFCDESGLVRLQADP